MSPSGLEEELENCECGGKFEEVNIRGMKFDGKVLDLDLIAPKCNQCGDLMLSGSLTGVIEDATKNRP